MPHPLEHSIVVKVQTNGNTKPIDAMNTAIRCLLEEIKGLEDNFLVRSSPFSRL
jgi:DNA-directed RNA polymerase subunit L